MSADYIPLYRKYRPQALGQLVGQQAIVQTLTNAILHNRLTHAYLFCGPRGTGKTSSARILAKSLNCANGPTPEPCQTCPSCMAITSGNALDVTEIDAASNNGVDQIRELTERVQFRAIEGKYRIYIIDEVHMLSTAAFNALLKTLEEPPPNVVFVFATTESHKVLPTIVSRCQRFDFSRITRQEIEAHLAEVAKLESIEIEPAALSLVARQAKGGMRDALSQLDQVAVFGRGLGQAVIGPDLVRQVTGGLTTEKLMDLIGALLAQQVPEMMQALKDRLDDGLEPTVLTKALLQHFRQLMLAKTCENATDEALVDVLDVSTEEVQLLKQQASLLSVEELSQLLQRMAQLELQLKASSHQVLWLEVAMIELCQRQKLYNLAQLAERITQLENQLAGAPVAAAPPRSAPQPVQAPAAPPAAVQAPVPTPEPIIAPSPAPVAAMAAPAPQPSQPEPVSTMSVEPPPVPSTPAMAASASGAPSMVELLNRIESPLTRSLLEQHAYIHEIEPNGDAVRLVVGFSSEATMKMFDVPQKVQLLQKAADSLFGKPCRISFTVGKPPEGAVKPQTPSLTADNTMPAAAASPMRTAAAPAMAEPNMPQQPVARAPLPPVNDNTDLNDAKRYTQSLLGARLL